MNTELFLIVYTYLQLTDRKYRYLCKCDALINLAFQIPTLLPRIHNWCKSPVGSVTLQMQCIAVVN